MHETCDECGFDGGAFDDDALLAALDDLGGQWQRLLTSAGEHLASRPDPRCGRRSSTPPTAAT